MSVANPPSLYSFIPLETHAEAIRNAKLIMMDERFSERTRVAVMRYLKHLVEDFSIDDGYVSRIHKMEWRVDDETND